MNENAPLPIGRRVAALRKLRGLSQAGLAARLHRSESWVTKIERGVRRIDSISVLQELSEVLGVSLSQLTGQGHSGGEDRGRRETADLIELCRVLDRPAIVGGDCRGGPRSVADLHREAAELTELYNTARYNFSEVLPKLPTLICQVQAAAHIASTTDRRLVVTGALNQFAAKAPELVWLEPTAASLVRDMLRRRRYVGEELRRVARTLKIAY